MSKKSKVLEGLSDAIGNPPIPCDGLTDPELYLLEQVLAYVNMHKKEVGYDDETRPKDLLRCGEYGTESASSLRVECGATTRKAGSTGRTRG